MVKVSQVWVLALVLVLALTLSAASQSTDKPADKADKKDVRLLEVGHIIKIDEKKRIITIEDPDESGRPQQPFGQFGRRGARGPRRGAYGRGGPAPNLPEDLQTKIWVTDTTVVKEDGKTILWNSLKKGDVIRVSGVAKKKDLEAKEIDRVPHV